MPRFNLPTKLTLLTELGVIADLTIDNIGYDASGMNLRKMLTVYEPQINTAYEVTLMSDDIGRWTYNRKKREWERV